MAGPNWKNWFAGEWRLVAFLVGVWLTLALFAAMEFGRFPHTTGGWILLVVLGPPIYLGLQALGEGVFEGLRTFPTFRRASIAVVAFLLVLYVAWLLTG